MLGSSILVSLASLFVSFVGFANQLVLAKLFGASTNMDAYLIAISIPMFISGVVSAALSNSLVPTLMRHKGDQVSYRYFSGLLLISLVVISLLISIVGVFAVPIQIGLLGKTLPIGVKDAAIEIARISWITVALTIVVSFFNAMHNAVNKFLLPVFTSAIPYVCMIVAGLLFAPSHGPLAVSVGMLVGFLIAIPVLLVPVVSTFELSVRCVLFWNEVAAYLFRAPLIILAMLCFTVFQSIDAYWAPQIGTGNLAYLGYSQRILVALGNLVIAGPAAVILPKLAEAYADGREGDLLQYTQRALRMVLAVAIPVALTVSVLADPLVRLVFERGAFDQNATHGVVNILPSMMVGMVAMLCVVIVFRALFARHEVVKASVLGILTTVLYFTMSGLLSQSLGVNGIALAYALSWWLILLLSVSTLWHGNLRMLLCKEHWHFIVQLTVLALITGSMLEIGRSWMVLSGKNIEFLGLQISVTVILALAVYFMVAIRILRIEDIRLIFDNLTSKFFIFLPWLRNKLTN